MADDTISRATAIETVRKAKSIGQAHRMLVQLPSAQPVEDARAMCGECDAWNQYKNYPQPRWIPCSERMPEEHEWIGTKKFGTTISNEVYVTFETPDGERFAKHISFQDGKPSSVDEQRMKVWYKGAKPIAWMPLPEPWKGGQDG